MNEARAKIASPKVFLRPPRVDLRMYERFDIERCKQYTVFSATEHDGGHEMSTVCVEC